MDVSKARKILQTSSLVLERMDLFTIIERELLRETRDFRDVLEKNDDSFEEEQVSQEQEQSSSELTVNENSLDHAPAFNTADNTGGQNDGANSSENQPAEEKSNLDDTSEELIGSSDGIMKEQKGRHIQSILEKLYYMQNEISIAFFKVADMRREEDKIHRYLEHLMLDEAMMDVDATRTQLDNMLIKNNHMLSVLNNLFQEQESRKQGLLELKLSHESVMQELLKKVQVDR